MNIGARTAMWSGGAKPWVNPYQTADNALVAMWDGEYSQSDNDTIYDVIGGLQAKIEDGPRTLLREFSRQEKCFTIRGVNLGLVNSDTIATILDSGDFELELVIERFDVTKEYGARAYFLSGKHENRANFDGCWSNGNMWYYVGLLGKQIAPQYGSGLYVGVIFYWYLSYDGSIVKIKYDNRHRGIVDFTSAMEKPDRFYAGSRILLLGNYYEWDNFCFNGKVYGIRIYNRSLTDEEKLERYAIDKARFGLT